MKNCLLLIFLITLPFLARAHSDDVNISNIEFDIYKSFDVINAKTGKQSKITPKQNKKIKIVGKNKWAYVIKIVDPYGNQSSSSYLVAHKWARRALNIQAALHAARLQKEIEQSTMPPVADCKSCGVDVDSNPEAVRAEPVTQDDLVSPDEKDVPVITSNTQWKPGCELLADEKNLKSSDTRKLFQCIRSIQAAINRGARDSRGRLDRSKVFKNLYGRLNKQEQKFAAFIFTSHGEASSLAVRNPPKHEEMIAVMKVIDNRMNASNNNRRATRKPFNQLDVALDRSQFSMYNKNDPNWRRVLDIDRRENFNVAIESFIKYQQGNLQPKPEVDRVYHYHTNYVSPNWKSNSKRVAISVDGKTVNGTSRVKHYFYRDIAWSRNPKTDWRN